MILGLCYLMILLCCYLRLVVAHFVLFACLLDVCLIMFELLIVIELFARFDCYVCCLVLFWFAFIDFVRVSYRLCFLAIRLRVFCSVVTCKFCFWCAVDLGFSWLIIVFCGILWSFVLILFVWWLNVYVFRLGVLGLLVLAFVGALGFVLVFPGLFFC